VTASGIRGIVLVARNQTLDPFVWTDVVFLGTRIRYLGGPVTFRNIQFINCTFDVADCGSAYPEFRDDAGPGAEIAGPRDQRRETTVRPPRIHAWRKSHPPLTVKDRDIG
jgi:hypothetical protein